MHQAGVLLLCEVPISIEWPKTAVIVRAVVMVEVMEMVVQTDRLPVP